MIMIAVGGARGVGKSTTLGLLTKLDPEIDLISLGDKLNDFSLRQTGTSIYDVSTPAKDQMRKAFTEELILGVQQNDGCFLLDLHYTDIREGVDKIIQPEVLIKNVDNYVVFDADAETIAQRSLNDPKKRNRITNLAYIEMDRFAEVSAARYLAEIYHRPYTYIDASHHPEDVVAELHRSLESFLFQGKNKEIK